MNDTIHALATAPGRAAIAVVRLSGVKTRAVIKSLAGEPPVARHAALRTLRNTAGERLDRALVLWMPGPSSFTGEDMAELHLHGGRAVTEAVIAELAALGSRSAGPGDFTRRAFENGKLDLTEAEATADLVDAQTQAQRRQALAQLEGATASRVQGWRSRLLRALAYLEAAVDFPDEDVPSDIVGRARPDLLALRRELADAASDHRGSRIRDGLRVALVGAPNAGKSSLLNALAGREAAIVTPIPGTTRDVVEVRLELAGVPCVLGDTAGLRESDDPIEAEGVRRARAWAEDADLRLWVSDATQPPASPPSWIREGDWLVVSQVDRPSARVFHVEPFDTVVTSVRLEDGTKDLSRRLEAWAVAETTGDEPPVVTRTRHRDRLRDAVVHLDRALYAQDAEVELLAEDVRLATRALERLTGRIDAETVLGEVFSAFCIGK